MARGRYHDEMRPLVLIGCLLGIAAAARPTTTAGPVAPQADYTSARAAAAALPQMHGLVVSQRGQLVLEYYVKGYSAIFVFRELDLVVAVTSATTVSDERRGYRRQLFDLLETHILPPPA